MQPADLLRQPIPSTGQETPQLATGLDIWIVHTGEPLPGAGFEMHAAQLAREIARRGHRVLWWNTAFDHFSKKWVYPEDTEIALDDSLTAFAIKGPGYKSNTSLRRMVDHRVIARRWTHLASARRKPDLLLVAMPPHDLAFAAVRYATARNIPVILDLRDPWPDALLDLLPSWSRHAARILLLNDFRMLRSAVRTCDSLVAVTHSLLDWGRASAQRAQSPSDRVFYTGAPRVNDDPATESVHRLLDQLTEAFVVVFVGSFGFYHSPFVAIDAARSLSGTDIHFVLAGSGDTFAELKQRASDLSNVHFTGWLSPGDAAALMRSGRVGICPTTQLQPIFPNKAAAYFREGLPVVSSFGGDLRSLIDKRNAGINYAPGDVTGFTNAIELLRRDEMLRASMSANAQRLYRDEFDAERNLIRFADHAELIAARRLPGRRE